MTVSNNKRNVSIQFSALRGYVGSYYTTFKVFKEYDVPITEVKSFLISSVIS